MEIKLWNQLILAFFLVSIAAGGFASNEGDAKKFLLPGDLKATYYNIHLITRPDEFQLGNESTFKFDVEMQIFMHAVGNNVTEIVMNSQRLTIIREAILYRSGQDPVSLGSGNYNSATEKLIFSLPSAVRKGECLRLDLNATVKHNDSVGFVYDFYYGKNGTKRWFLYTELQPAYARLVFPCFDEPKYKALYNVSVSIPNKLISEGYHALSNAPESRRKKEGKNTIIYFEQTIIPMSTYLFAVVVSDFAATKPLFFSSSYPHLKRGELRTWGKLEDLDAYEGDFPQKVAHALIKIYSKDFGIGYDFGKIDQIALHGYLGGMENWGLILYSRDIVTDRAENSATLIAHELAHQWFGNLITFHWWSDVWLNEGFASYFEFFAADKINEEGINGKQWNLPYHFVIEMIQSQAMLADVPEEFNNPLTVEVYDPNEYNKYFDDISYGKGASIIYMWRNVFGEKAFVNVLRYYLRSLQTGVTTPELLLNCFDRFANESESEMSGMKPSEIFRNWHLKAGLPIINVRKNKVNSTNYVVSQDVFRLKKETKVEKAEWTIPISYSSSENFNFNKTKAEYWLTPKQNITVKLPKPAKWIILNNQESGYYRVNYDIENWKALFRALNESKNEIHEINRAQIIDDSFEIARSTAFDYLEYDLVLDMMLYLQKENSQYPWKSALKKLEFLKKQIVKYELVYPLFQKFVLSLLMNRVESSWLVQRECNPNKEYKFEKTVISWACEMGHSSCYSESKRLLIDRNKLCSDSLDVAYCAFIRSHGEKFTWEELWNDYLVTEDTRMKKSILRGLGCIENQDILNRLLEKSIAINDEVSREERSKIVSSILMGNAKNARTLLTFVEKNLKEVLVALRRNHLKWDLFVDIARGLSTDEELSRMRQMMISLGKLSQMDLRRTKFLKKAMSIVEANNEWQKIRSKSVSDWLISRYSPQLVH